MASEQATKIVVMASDLHKTVELLVDAIEDIRQVAAGEIQIGNDDTEGLEWIVKRIAAVIC